LSFTAIWVWPEKSCSTGSCSAPGTPSAVSEGPRARTTIVLGALPPMMKPPIITSSPVSTLPRVAMLASRGGFCAAATFWSAIVAGAAAPATDAVTL
jgi:hypothetical protein